MNDLHRGKSVSSSVQGIKQTLSKLRTKNNDFKKSILFSLLVPCSHSVNINFHSNLSQAYFSRLPLLFVCLWLFLEQFTNLEDPYTV